MVIRMNVKSAEALLRSGNFEAVMTGAARGPDMESQRELKAITAMLRWAIGFDYGTRDRLQTPGDWQEYDGLACMAAPWEDDHCTAHLRAAIKALRDCGWEISRVPFAAYCDPEIAYLTGSKVLYHAQVYCEHQANTTAAMLVNRAHDVLDRSGNSTLQLTLPNY